MLLPLMQNLTAADVADALPYGALIDALDRAFASDVEVPHRAHHDVAVPGGADGTLLLMPAWRQGGRLGVKIATVFPDNVQRSLPAVFASYFLADARTGVPVAVLDGTELTLRRTAAASALASRYLSRSDARTLLVIGTGNLAPHLVRAHAVARPIERVLVWGRRPEAAADVVAALRRDGLDASVAGNLDDAIPEADILSSATLSAAPLIGGERLCEGQHVDLVGAFRPNMREADGAALKRAQVYVDTRAGAQAEAGDILLAIGEGAITIGDIRGELADLVTGRVQGRTDDRAITLFKSVGTALEDLAAAELAMKRTAPR